MGTTSSGNQPENNSNPYNNVDQQCSANPNCDDQFSPRDLFIQKICYNPDPEVCFRNLLKLITNSKKHLRSFENCIERFVKMKFDKTLDIDIKRYEPLFKKYHQGFSRKFNCRKAKNSDLYGPDAFIWTLEHYLVDSDYKFKKQKIKSEEFGFIAYLLTEICLKYGDIHMVHRNFFMGKKDEEPCLNIRRYKDYTGRRLNNDKLNYIITVLTSYDIIIEEKLGVKGKTHLRNFYSIGTNNPYYGYILPSKKLIEEDDLDF